MLTVDFDLYMRIEQLSNGPKPLPLDSGFNEDTAYKTLGLFNPSETSDAYFIFANDRDEVWFICNRHLRVAGLIKNCTLARIKLSDVRSFQLGTNDNWMKDHARAAGSQIAGPSAGLA